MKKLVALMMSAFLCVSMMTTFMLIAPPTSKFDTIATSADELNESVESEEPVSPMYEVPDHIGGEY